MLLCFHLKGIHFTQKLLQFIITIKSIRGQYSLCFDNIAHYINHMAMDSQPTHHSTKITYIQRGFGRNHCSVIKTVSCYTQPQKPLRIKTMTFQSILQTLSDLYFTVFHFTNHKFINHHNFIYKVVGFILLLFIL